MPGYRSPFTYGSFNAPTSYKQANSSFDNLNTSSFIPDESSRQSNTLSQEQNTSICSSPPKNFTQIKPEPKNEHSSKALDLSVPPPDLTLIPRPLPFQAACMPRSAYLDSSVSEPSEFFGHPMMMLSGDCFEFLSSPNPQLHLVIGVAEGENAIGSLFFGNEAVCSDERILSFFKIKHAISPSELLNPTVSPNLHFMRVPYYEDASFLDLSFGYIWESIHQCRMTGSNVLIVGHPFNTAAMVCILSYIMTRYHTTLNSVLSAFANLSIFPHLQSFELSALLKLETRVKDDSAKTVIRPLVPTVPNAKTPENSSYPYAALPSPLPHPHSPSSPSETEFQVFSDFILEVRCSNMTNPRWNFLPQQDASFPSNDGKFTMLDNFRQVTNSAAASENFTNLNSSISAPVPRRFPKKAGPGRKGQHTKRKVKGGLFKNFHGQEKILTPKPPSQDLPLSHKSPLRATLHVNPKGSTSNSESILSTANLMNLCDSFPHSPITLVQPNTSNVADLGTTVPSKSAQSLEPTENIQNSC